MIPKLYAPTDHDFSKNGIGLLTDCKSCLVKQELTDRYGFGEYELTLEYPLNGIHVDEIQSAGWILAKPNHFDAPQPFRIYSIKKTLFQTIIVKAEHISYGLDAVPIWGIASGTASNSIAAMNWFNNQQAFVSGFVLHSGYFEGPSNRIVSHVEPVSARYLLNEFVSFFKTELKIDGKEITMVSHVGENRGVSIRYGKNLKDLSMSELFQNKYTGVYPYIKRLNPDKGSVEYAEMPGKIFNAYPELNIVRAVPADLTDRFEGIAIADITQEDWEWEAGSFMADDDSRRFQFEPDLNFEMSYVDFKRYMEYNGVEAEADVGLGDTIKVIYGAFRVNIEARVIVLTYDSLNEINDNLVIGNFKRNIVDTLARQQAQINKLNKRS